MKTKKIRRLKLRQELGTRAMLTRIVLGSSVGISVLLIGLGITFRSLLSPGLESLEASWNGMLNQFVDSQNVEATTHLIGGILLILGALIFLKSIRNLVHVLVPAGGANEGLMSAYMTRQRLEHGPKIVAIGGGTGLSTLLRGLKQHSSSITALVTVTDDGGSSGRLMQEMSMIPPGDIRNCLAALADAEKLTTDLFQHRFEKGAGAFGGHSLGNLLIAGFLDQAGGDLDLALEHASEVLAIRGRVLPSTKSIVGLQAEMVDGTIILGETALVASEKTIKQITLTRDDVELHPQALKAIEEADLICLGPGSIYTSVIPNLLIPGMAEALNKADGLKAYICNVMTQKGESDYFTAADHLLAIKKHVDVKVIDCMLVNSAVPSAFSQERYQDSRQDVVQPDLDRIRAAGCRPIPADLMSESDYVRHDPAKVAAKLMDILYR
jgi:uncharacterized cofD-like protein